MSLHGKNFIGARLSSGTGETFNSVSPLDSSTLPGSFYSASGQDADQAVELAEEGFRIYSKTSGEERAAFLARSVSFDCSLKSLVRDPGLMPESTMRFQTGSPRQSQT